MATMTDRNLLWVNDSYDREYASDGVSRYGAYLRQRATQFLDPWEDVPTTEASLFAAIAFEIASGPVMSPGYVGSHPRVTDLRLHCDDDGRRAIQLDLAISLPSELRRAMPLRWQDWQQPRGEDGRWQQPYDNDRLTVTTAITVRVPFPAADLLPGAFYDQHGNPDTPAAQGAVAVLVAHVNTELAGVFVALTGARR